MTANIPDPNERFDWDAAEAEVFDLNAARTRRAGDADQRPTDPDNNDDGREDQGDDDAESFDDRPDAEGAPVDAADDIPAAAFDTRNHRPILATWARSWTGWKAAARWWAKYAGYVAAYH